MPASDPVALPARPTGGLAEAVRGSARLALLLALLTALVVGVSGALVLRMFERHHMQGLQEETGRLMSSVDLAVTATLQRAVDLGIPLDALYEADSFLGRALADNPRVARIEVRDGAEQVLYGVGTAPSGSVEQASLTLTRDGAAVGTVVVMASNEAMEMLHRRLTTVLALLVLACAVVGFLAARVLLAERQDLPYGRLVGSLRAVVRGNFGDYTPVPDGSALVGFARAVSTLMAPVRRQARGVRAVADEIRAVDLDGTLAEPVARVQSRVDARFRFGRGLPRKAPRLWPGWWALPAVILAEATRPLVASFAADRADTDSVAALAIALSFGAQALGLAFAALLLRRRGRAVDGWLIGLCLLLAGGANVATLSTHHLDIFVLCRAVAGFAAGFAVMALLLQPGGYLRLPWRGFLLLLAEIAALLLGTLAAELLGRRLGFVASGAGLALLAVPVFMLPGERLAAWYPRRPARDLVVVAVVGVATLLWLFAYDAAFLLRHDYLSIGLLVGAWGLGTLAGWAAGRRLPVPAGLLLAALSLVLPLLPVFAWQLPLTSLLLGLGCGIAIRQSARALWTPDGGMALAAGLALAALAMILLPVRQEPMALAAGGCLLLGALAAALLGGARRGKS